MFAVCKWLGNSPTVAKQHYLHLTDLDFDRATGIDQPAWRGKMRATAGQKAGQQGAARRRITTHLELANIKKALQTQSFCIEDGIIGTLTIPTQVPPRGVELSDDSPGNKPVSKSGGAECGPLEIEIPPDAELVELILSWHELPEETKILVSRHFHDL